MKQLEIGLLTWKWQYDSSGSGWSFQAGQPYLEVNEIKNPPGNRIGYRTIHVFGEQGIHVMSPTWRFMQGDELIVGSDSDNEEIGRKFRWLDGLRLLCIEIVPAGWVSSAVFERDVVATI